jgi:diacylglycerol kinase (ATP)
MKSVVVIANPFAGTSKGRLSGPDAVALLEQRGFVATLRLTEGSGHATTLAAEASVESDLVVAVGGDGTIHEVAAGLVGTDCPLGVLPSGSGNDFAVGIGSGTVEAGLDAISAGIIWEIDVCGLDGRPFINSMGLLASGVISLTAARLWRWMGKWRYTVASLWTILTYHGQQVTWAIDYPDATSPSKALNGKFLMAEFCNGPLTGGGFKLVDGADFADGLMDLCVVHPIGLAAGLRILPGAAAGRMIEHPAFSRHQSRRVAFTLAEPTAYHLDGEAAILEAGDHVVEVLGKKLKVMVPA